MPIISRLAGYYMGSKTMFNTEIDKNDYNIDIKTIGFDDGIYSVNFEIFIKNILGTILENS